MSVRWPLSTTYTGARRRSRARIASRSRLHDLVGRIEQPRHLAGMRRDDDVHAVASDQAIRLADERVQAVGIEDERHAGALESAWTNADVPGAWPSPGPTAMTSRVELEHAIDARCRRPCRPPSRRAPRSCTRAPSPRRRARHDRGRGDRHQPGARPQRADAARCAAPVLPTRAGDDQHAAVVALV